MSSQTPSVPHNLQLSRALLARVAQQSRSAIPVSQQCPALFGRLALSPQRSFGAWQSGFVVLLAFVGSVATSQPSFTSLLALGSLSLFSSRAPAHELFRIASAE